MESGQRLQEAGGNPDRMKAMECLRIRWAALPSALLLLAGTALPVASSADARLDPTPAFSTASENIGRELKLRVSEHLAHLLGGSGVLTADAWGELDLTPPPRVLRSQNPAMIERALQELPIGKLAHGQTYLARFQSRYLLAALFTAKPEPRWVVAVFQPERLLPLVAHQHLAWLDGSSPTLELPLQSILQARLAERSSGAEFAELPRMPLQRLQYHRIGDSPLVLVGVSPESRTVAIGNSKLKEFSLHLALGGVAGLCVVGLALLMRRRRSRRPSPATSTQYEPPTLAAPPWMDESIAQVARVPGLQKSQPVPQPPAVQFTQPTASALLAPVRRAGNSMRPDFVLQFEKQLKELSMNATDPRLLHSALVQELSRFLESPVLFFGFDPRTRAASLETDAGFESNRAPLALAFQIPAAAHQQILRHLAEGYPVSLSEFGPLQRIIMERMQIALFEAWALGRGPDLHGIVVILQPTTTGLMRRQEIFRVLRTTSQLHHHIVKAQTKNAPPIR